MWGIELSPEVAQRERGHMCGHEVACVGHGVRSERCFMRHLFQLEDTMLSGRDAGPVDADPPEGVHEGPQEQQGARGCPHPLYLPYPPRATPSQGPRASLSTSVTRAGWRDT